MMMDVMTGRNPEREQRSADDFGNTVGAWVTGGVIGLLVGVTAVLPIAGCVLVGATGGALAHFITHEMDGIEEN